MLYTFKQAAEVCKCSAKELLGQLQDGDTAKVEGDLYVTRLALQRLAPDAELPKSAVPVAQYVSVEQRLTRLEARLGNAAPCAPGPKSEPVPAPPTPPPNETTTKGSPPPTGKQRTG